MYDCETSPGLHVASRGSSFWDVAVGCDTGKSGLPQPNVKQEEQYHQSESEDDGGGHGRTDAGERERNGDCTKGSAAQACCGSAGTVFDGNAEQGK